jgi:hypothetical protein
VKARIVPTAEQFVGWLKEATGKNDGPWVEAVQRVTGNRKGDPWCASFVTTVLDIAYRGPENNPLARSASCDVMLEFARKRGWLTDKPAVGDLFLVMKDPTDAVHVGIVSAVGKFSFKTIEGNTNGAGSRDGWGVFGRERKLGPTIQFIRLPADPKPEPKAPSK